VIIARLRYGADVAASAIPITRGSCRAASANRVVIGATASQPTKDSMSVVAACPTASGIIEGYRAEVSRSRAGLGLTVFIALKVEGHSKETSSRIEQALLTIPAVVACHVVSGSDDFLVEAAVPDLASYEQLLLGQILTIPSVVEARSTFAIRTVLSRGPMPLAHWR
jgi:hypothetical protein